MDDVTCVCGSEMERIDGDLFRCGACGRLWEFSAGFFESLACYVVFVYEGRRECKALDITPEEAMDMLLDIRHDYAIALASGEDNDLSRRQRWALIAGKLALPENCHWLGGYGAYTRRIQYTIPEEAAR